jgi:uncharacterized OB-fold protein
VSGERDVLLPDTGWELTRPFWEAAGRGELVIPRCRACDTWCWYPSERCVACGGTELPWVAVSGRGTLFSWAVVRRAFVKSIAHRVPYVSGLVALEEDPAVRLVTTLVDCDPDALHVDQPVHVVFRPFDVPDAPQPVIAPMFTPSVQRSLAGSERNSAS